MAKTDDRFLVTQTTYFVDPHGSPDKGGIKKFITDSDWYKTTPEGKYLDGEEYVDEDDLRGSEDGYNSQAYKYTVRKLDPSEVEHIQTVISAYENLR
jgi:hypothetical protein